MTRSDEYEGLSTSSSEYKSLRLATAIGCFCRDNCARAINTVWIRAEQANPVLLGCKNIIEPIDNGTSKRVRE